MCYWRGNQRMRRAPDALATWGARDQERYLSTLDKLYGKGRLTHAESAAAEADDDEHGQASLPLPIRGK